MAQPLTIEPLDATFGAVATGFRIAELDDETFQALYAAWLKYALLIFPGQNLTREQQIAFAKRFGPLEFEMTALSNVKEDGSLRLEKDNDDRMKILKGNMGWHADSTYMPVQAKGAVFCAEEVPTIGGHTGWADMRAAYDALDPAMKARIEGLNAYHSLHYSQGRVGHQTRKLDGEYSGYGLHDGPVPLRPLVKTHPETGRKSLLAGRHAHNIPGLVQQDLLIAAGHGSARVDNVVAVRARATVVEITAVRDLDRSAGSGLEFRNARPERGLQRRRRGHHRSGIGILRKHGFLDLRVQGRWIAQHGVPVLRPQPGVVIRTTMAEFADDARFAARLRWNRPAGHGRQTHPGPGKRRDRECTDRDQEAPAISHRGISCASCGSRTSGR